ncbi:hypothetical protein EG19_07290 [Thermoanaerobaculum aquaticum]|uniref:Uncharacterized protein n=1 Tax=Thermoanaerobaculum aquaticum TaxID=1312852 RepID=A0A062XKU1_9BACT|nr:GspB domain-containing protein [Thermoanaerobaculum aquaticum]KDA53172.1 hypothetical protein EG19_07290 [Thermoanaerobaculum aquaticum]
MSLVSEALRKARAQQLRQAAEGGQLPPAVAPAPPRKRALSFLLVVSLLSGLAGASLVAIFWSHGPASPKPHLAPASPLPSPQPAPAIAAAVPVPTPAPLQNPLPSSSPSPEAPPSQEAPVPNQVQLPSVPQPVPPPTAKPAISQEFAVQAKLPDRVLTLDFLVYGPTRSFARINGQEVVEGSTVAGFVVEKILEDRVILRQGQETVVLKTR